ncbi:MAG: S9 family peptidase [Candidatus Acidiferrales bacterium]
MKIGRLALIFIFSLTLFASDSPDTREITDPKSLNSLAEPSAAPVPIDDLFYTRSINGGAWSPDGKEIVFTTNLTGRLNLWKVSAEGGWPVQLSQSDDRQYGGVWSPDGKWIVFASDKGGGEIYDLFAIPSDGGEIVNLTNTPDISENSAVWSPDGSRMAISYKPKTASAIDVAILDWKTHEVHNLTQEKTKDHIWGGAFWSPDGKYIFATRSDAGFNDSDVYRVDVTTGASENLTPHQGQNRSSLSSVSPDGRTLLVTSDKPGGYPNVAFLDVATKQITWATDTKWEAQSGDFSPDGKQFTYIVNEDGRSDAYLADVSTHRGEKIKFPAGLNTFAGNPSSFSPRGGRLLVEHQSSTQPDDLWVYDISKQAPQQLTISAIASLASAKIPPSVLVHYKSFDGKIISAFAWIPYNLKRDGSNPAIVLPHGGPTGQTIDYFSRTTIALVSRGYICIAPNVRGSTGYGLDFQKANYKDLGGGDLQDEVYAVKFLEASGYADSRKIGITGGSYGGFMTLMAIGKTPDLWAAAVEEYGIINWLTMIKNEDPFLREYEKSILGDPEKDRAIYEADSPLAYIRNTKAPLLVLQGDNDIRVPKEEAQQVVEILKQNGKTVDVHYYGAEGHGFTKRENQIDAMHRMIDWFDRYLKNTASH